MEGYLCCRALMGRSDALADGRVFRTLNIIDDFSRECVAIEVDTSLGGERVVRVWSGSRSSAWRGGWVADDEVDSHSRL